jgi:hypothetical protein
VSAWWQIRSIDKGLALTFVREGLTHKILPRTFVAVRHVDSLNIIDLTPLRLVIDNPLPASELIDEILLVNLLTMLEEGKDALLNGFCDLGIVQELETLAYAEHCEEIAPHHP